MVAKVTSGNRTQKRIDKGVQCDICVRMSFQTHRRLHLDPAQAHRRTGPKTVDIEAMADPERKAHDVTPNICLITTRSRSVVSLGFG